ncbi:MAG: type II toxin-antitoxin system PemK/MazF family toxin [Pigmentiphaga sp.]|nr:type II toxin-antitoxin system PemK/MazF family toxin [Pigmentiphaga sp.]
MIWIDFNPQTGREMRDEHPMLVLSGRAFNERTGIVIGFPMTSSDSNATNPFAISFQKGGKTSYVLTHQPKSFDWRRRHARAHPWKQVPENVFTVACASLNQIIALA